jgi:UDP-arabinose 4-epimerase
MSRTVLVTGGAGYIGSHACKNLSAAGYSPVTVDNFVYGHEWAVKWGPLIKGDIHDGRLLDQVFRSFHPVAVIHFAAFAYVGESVSDPGKYYQNNVAGTISLLEAMRRNGCSSIVFSSTCATYGNPDRVPISEGHPQRPINPYGRSKFMIEQILRDFYEAYGLRYASLRYFNAAGGDPDGEIGEDHEPETHLIPLVVHAALGLRPFVEVFGIDYPTPDGTAVRDYIHVTDLAEAHVLALQHLLAGGESVCLNLGTGKGHSVREVIRAVEEETGTKVPVREAPRRAGDPPMLVAEAARAAAQLLWKPRFTDIRYIVGTALQWHRCRTVLNGDMIVKRRT